ncbi:MAG: GyrI-like domain-containing protein [Pseudomonadota bacterium]
MTNTNYTLNCMERAVTFMSGAVGEARVPSLDEIATASGLSKFHFHRLFRLVTGETCSDALTRIRLARAANLLKDPAVTVTDAAFSAGYGSSQSFAKALKRVLDQSASSLRASDDRLAAAVETLAVPEQASATAMRIEIAAFDPFDVITIRTDGTYPALNVVYGALFEAAGDPGLVDAILGTPFGDIGSAEDLRFDCALKLAADADALPEGVSRTRIDGGAFLLARHVGSYDGLPDTLDQLYLAALAAEDIRIGAAPALFHYLDDPETTAEADLRTDLYLPVRAVDGSTQSLA